MVTMGHMEYRYSYARITLPRGTSGAFDLSHDAEQKSRHQQPDTKTRRCRCCKCHTRYPPTSIPCECRHVLHRRLNRCRLQLRKDAKEKEKAAQERRQKASRTTQHHSTVRTVYNIADCRGVPS